ncbi:uncharacterized protein LOC121241549 isoform X2 [Juglans microcarpa x Juglans regia]|uniref:uncharacterized protein LOC121241549 isoform X2 n=1 Tax=Juglans microcarpa x Juglans regia TaxID=2249226 RepID=UPI001B7F36DC|nr:uncharacterized protein LOC121241549 isoform X2 [Juglans microcarpa x Juglans regia]
MESRLKEEEGEEGQLRDNVQQLDRSLLSHSRKLVPWLNWDEWLFVEHSLFSDSPDTVASALRRILAWQSRGCLPVAIEVTASIIEIQQKDPHFRKDQSHGATFDYREDQTNNGSLSEEILAMLYCMAIIRLVNGVIEKARKKTEVSIAVAADAIGIPRMLIDIRHEGSHRELPALKMVRSASVKALDWLKSYYWEPQKKAIPFQGAGTTSVREEIKFKLSELALALKFKQSPLCSSSPKGKRSRHCELLWGRNKFFSLVGRKHQLSKSGVSKKQITKNLKILVQLYSSFPSEVVSILLEFLSKAINSSDLVELPEDFQVGPITCTALDNWKLVITKLSNKEPELLLTLLKAVLDMIETQEAMKYETGRQHQTWSDYRQDISQIEHLSSMFAWLIESLKGLKRPGQKFSAAEIEVYPTETNVSKTVLLELLHKCLLVSASGNKQLMDSALHLAQLMGQSILIEKLKKLPSLDSSNLYVTEEEIPSMTKLLTQQEESISQAAKKLELVKLNRMKSKVAETRSGDAKNINKWIVSRSWNPCPIGMLPHTLGSSGCLPVLERCDVHGKVPESSEREGNWDLNRCSSKREASCDIQQIDKSSVKKRKETMEACASDAIPSMEGVKGHLMIGGIWMGVGEDELLAMESDVRILV